MLGLWMSLLLSLALIIRIGIRAGEIELYKYWQLFSNLSEPTFICDHQGKILLANPALIKAFSLEQENQVAGKYLNDFFDSQSLPEKLTNLSSRKVCSFEISRQPNGTPFLISLNPIFSGSRKKMVAGVAHDLSEQKHQQEVIQKAYTDLQVMHRQLENLNGELEQKVEQRTSTLKEAYQLLEAQNKLLQELDQLKSDFVSMVSHELRTPLTSLNGGLELLIRRKDKSITDQEPLLLMKNEVLRLTRFVENILALSAIEAGRLEPHPSLVTFPTVMENVLSPFSTSPGVERIEINLAEDLPSVHTDPGFLESVLIHLVDNSLKYSHQGEIRVDAFRFNTRVRIQVTDSGPGIPRDKQTLLFNRFQRFDVKDSQSVYGYGLGLYLSQCMLQAMGSVLEFEEPSETGARFYFDIKVEE
jgi:PAS domain S-box-containing protein